MPDTHTKFVPPHPLLVQHGFRIQAMYAAATGIGHPMLGCRKFQVRGQLRTEGLRALVRLYERFSTKPGAIAMWQEELRRRVARDWARQRIECGCAIEGDVRSTVAA